MINDIAFKGKRSVEWSDVEKYLRQYVGDIYRIAETEDIIYIGTDLLMNILAQITQNI